jgi:hypothetical protein
MIRHGNANLLAMTISRFADWWSGVRRGAGTHHDADGGEADVEVARLLNCYYKLGPKVGPEELVGGYEGGRGGPEGGVP